ncbi:MAG: hypothetical protein MN733_01525, partial [Nitrososphaera sp.]|nr:hypothetical protein [Nitrososphaera sp.]
ALGAQPRLLIADEPTSALDVSIAAEIVSLLANLQQAFGLAILVITHDLNIATRLADRIAVLDHTSLAEELPARQFLAEAQHPASQRLIKASRFMSTAVACESTHDQPLLNGTVFEAADCVISED